MLKLFEKEDDKKVILDTCVLIDIFGYNGFPIAIIIGCISYLTFLIFYKNYQ